MSIKSADIVRKLIFKDKTLTITPLLDPQKQLAEGSDSVDLRLGTRFLVSRRGGLTHVDTQDEESINSVIELQDSFYVPIGSSFVLHPNHFVLANTLEYLRLPSNLAANVVTRSSWGRHGLIIATAVSIHPGFVGVLTLELRNLAEIPLILHPGRRILQIFFFDVETMGDNIDQSQYLASTKPGIGRFDSEKDEIDIIEKFPAFDKNPLT